MNQQEILDRTEIAIGALVHAFEIVDRQLDARDRGELEDIHMNMRCALESLRRIRHYRNGLREKYHDDLTPIHPLTDETETDEEYGDDDDDSDDDDE